MARHSERCKACKTAVLRMLSALYGEVKESYRLAIPTAPNAYSETQFGDVLQRIYDGLSSFRGHKNFVRISALAPVDFYVPSMELVVEFDESQHFTEPRALTLALYPKDLAVHFDSVRWQELSAKLKRHDRDPAYRDEQRAWYDALRDFAPLVFGYGHTARLYAQDRVWCAMDPSNEANRVDFLNLINMQRGDFLIPISSSRK
ncbi:hypothetical protein [Cupriavidus sp. BIS7]|uniref:hypothetical protein n=1 Tax=Cupriavidus sp. BIS7 TaxID=1217718 RepID=UPI0012F63F40|nr:hypothetical protein [Cupriavidus sp. BIS7]